MASLSEKKQEERLKRYFAMMGLELKNLMGWLHSQQQLQSLYKQSSLRKISLVNLIKSYQKLTRPIKASTQSRQSKTYQPSPEVIVMNKNIIALIAIPVLVFTGLNWKYFVKAYDSRHMLAMPMA